MPSYQITSPDGRTFRIDAPDGATQEDALAYVQAHHAATTPSTDNASFYEDQVKAANQAKPWYQNLAEGIPRGMERGTLGLMQGVQSLAHAVDPSLEVNPDLADIAKQTRIAGEGTGVAGSIGEMLDPRMSALMATGPMGLAARGITGAVLGATNPVETTDATQANLERLKSAGLNSAGFMAIPPLLEGAGNVVGAISDKLGEGGAGAFPGVATRAAAAASNNATIKQDISGSAYDNIAKILVNQGGMTPDEAMNAAKNMAPIPQSGQTTVPMTLPEATGNTNLLGRQRALGEQINDAGSKFSKFNQSRLQNEFPQAKDSLVATAAGNQPVTTLTDAGSKIQDAATKILENSRAKLRSIGTGYNDLLATEIPTDTLQELRTNPVIEDTYQSVLKNPTLMGKKYEFSADVPPELEQAIGKLSPDAQTEVMKQLGVNPNISKKLTGGFSDTSFNALKATKEQLDALAREQYNKFGRSAPEGVAYTRAANDVRDFLNATEDKYAQLNKVYGAERQNVVSMEKSPIGKLATANDPESAARIVMNMSREQLQSVIPQLQKVNPEAVKSMAGAVLRQKTDSVSDGTITSYLNTISKNTVVRDKMKALIGDDAYNAQQELAATLKKVAAGQPTNSTTAPKLLINQQIETEAQNPAFSAAENLANIPTTKAGAIRAALQWAQHGKNYVQSKMNEQYKSQLMDVFINPDLDKLGAALSKVSNKSDRENLILQYIGGVVGNDASQHMIKPADQKKKLQPANYAKGGPVKRNLTAEFLGRKYA